MDINNFGPFNSGVWGTMSDWVTILVTSVTAYYLYRTLQSQKNLNILQEKAVNIEQERYNLLIRPDVEVTHDLNTKTVFITPINRELINVDLEIVKVSDSVQNLASINAQDQGKNYLIGQKLPIQYILNEIPVINPYILFTIKIIYEDEIGNNYAINIAVIPNSDPVKIGPRKIIK